MIEAIGAWVVENHPYVLLHSIQSIDAGSRERKADEIGVIAVSSTVSVRKCASILCKCDISDWELIVDQDAEDVAQALRTWSNGDIKVSCMAWLSTSLFIPTSRTFRLMVDQTGVYHAGMEEYEKERIHVQWREGKVK